MPSGQETPSDVCPPGGTITLREILSIGPRITPSASAMRASSVQYVRVTWAPALPPTRATPRRTRTVVRMCFEGGIVDSSHNGEHRTSTLRNRLVQVEQDVADRRPRRQLRRVH